MPRRGPSSSHLSIGEARRLAIAAQGLDRGRPRGRIGARHVEETIHRMGLLQLDFVNVLVPAPELVLFSRLGPYDRDLLHEVVYRRRGFTEQWAHEACIVPMSTWPLLAHRRESHRNRPWGIDDLLRRHPGYEEAVVEEIRRRGPLSAAEVPGPEGADRRLPGTWYRSIPRVVLEALFGRGRLAVAARARGFDRVFDLAERVVPAEQHGRRVEKEHAERELLRLAARAHGLGTASDLADYYRMRKAEALPRLRELVEEGELSEVRVEGWREAAYVAAGARASRRPAFQDRGARPRRPSELPGRAALLSPFDPLVFCRDRIARLFGFEYRIEIYVPAPKRRWGYYVLPFLLGDRLVARVDVKADRAGRRLLVPSAHLEAHADASETASALAEELSLLAAWLRLDRVVVGRRGSLARALASAVRSR